jgi:succinoglycan biosynthesis protein ExoM
MLLSVCVATYKRVRLLTKLLDSIFNQELPDELKLEVIVVDNDSECSAREIAKSFKNQYPLKLYYFSQPIKNISITRNKAVQESRGEYLLFIDDDEVAEKNWVKSLFNALFNFDADGVFGKVDSYFEDGTPEWIRDCFVYDRPISHTGTIADSKRSGNCIIKSSLLKTSLIPFDPAYGLTGGEDTVLFNRLESEGAKFINCEEAVTYEYVPPERTRFKWLISRAFAMGNGYARRMIALSKNYKMILRLKFIVIGLGYGLLSSFFFVITSLNKKSRLNWILKIFSNAGKIAASLSYSPQRYR